MKLIKVIPIILLLSGCASLGFNPPGVVLLPEERVFTLPAGEPVGLLLDGKPLDITFVEDMKVVHPTTIIRYEEMEAKSNRKGIMQKRSRKQTTGIVGGIITLLSSLVVIWKRASLKGMFKKITISAK